MQKVLLHRVLPSLVLSVMIGGLSPFATYGQESSLKLVAFAGTFLSADGTEPNSATIPLLGAGVQFPLTQGIEARLLAVTGLGPNLWFCPVKQWAWDYGQSLAGILDFAFPVGLGADRRLVLEPFLGVGIATVSEGDIGQLIEELGEDLDPATSFAVGSSTDVLLTYGVSLILSRGRVAPFIKLRGTDVFVGEQELTPVEGGLEPIDLGIATAVSASIGLVIRLGAP